MKDTYKMLKRVEEKLDKLLPNPTDPEFMENLPVKSIGEFEVLDNRMKRDSALLSSFVSIRN